MEKFTNFELQRMAIDRIEFDINFLRQQLKRKEAELKREKEKLEKLQEEESRR